MGALLRRRGRQDAEVLLIGEAADQFSRVMTRIASAVDVQRIRREDAERTTSHGGSVADIAARIEAVLPDLEAVAAQLEGA